MNTFPIVQGSNLEGRRFVLPEDFEGAWNLVLIPFEMEHQLLVDTWLPFARELRQHHPELRVYELPTMRNFRLPERMLIDHWMRMGIPDRATRQITITLYLDVERFIDALDLPHPRTAYTLLVDQAGKVLARTMGAFNVAKAHSILAALPQHQHV
jgi:hypothetical protein